MPPEKMPPEKMPPRKVPSGKLPPQENTQLRRLLQQTN